MQDEFEKLLKFFEMEPEEKTEKLGEVFEDATVFLERFKEVFEKGSVEEKKAFMEKVMALQGKVKDETKKLCEMSGLSEEQITQFAMNPQNFSKEQWETISQSKSQLEEQAQKIRDQFGPGGEKKPEETKPKKPKGPGGKAGWIPS